MPPISPSTSSFIINTNLFRNPSCYVSTYSTVCTSAMADRTCPCGKGDDFKGNNCAHYLTNWMIVNGALQPYPAGCYCCEEGRPIRAKDVKSHIFEEQYGPGKTSPPKDGSNCFVYCYKASNDRGHVYYGREDYCAAGTGTAPSYETRRYYYNGDDDKSSSSNAASRFDFDDPPVQEVCSII